MKMRNFVVFNVLFIALLALSGCQGTNSDAPTTSSTDQNTPIVDQNTTIDQNTTTVDSKYSNYSLTVFPDTNVTITEGLQTKAIDVYLGDSSTKMPVVNEVVNLEFFDASKGTMNLFSASTDVNGHVAFNYTAPSDIDNLADYNLTFRLNGDVNKTDFTTVIFNKNAAVNPKYKNYVLTVVHDGNVTITQGSESKAIDVYVEDNSTNKPVANEIVDLKFFDGSKGTTYSFSATTDVNGHAVFNYIAPSNITGLADYNLTFRLDGDTSISDYITTIFTPQPAIDPKYSKYMLTVIPDNNLTVTANSQSKAIDVYLEDNATKKPVANETVNLNFFDGSKGTMNSFSASTDVNGHVAFNYTAPSDIAGLNGQEQNLTFRLNADENVTDFTTVIFTAPPAIDPKYSKYVLTVIPDNNLTVTANSQSKAIDVYLEDNATKKPVANETVNLNFFDGSKGTMNSFSASTDVNGHVAFNYTAPSDIAGLNGQEQNLTFRLNADENVTDFTTVKFDSTVSLNYLLTIVNPNRVITASNQTEVFNLYIENNTTNTPVSGEAISLNYFDGNKGSVNSFNATTDILGHATFTYTAPSNLADLNGTILTFKMQSNPSRDVNATLTVSATVTQLPNIHLQNSNVTISKNSENTSVKILAFNSNNEVFNSGSIVVRYPNEITDSNVSGGKFTQSEVAIVNGEAIFDFVGPNPLISISSLNFTFVYKENNDINTTLTINYVPEIPKIVLNDSNITVTTNGEIVNVGVNIYTSDNAPYPDGNIKIKYPNDVLSGKDVGSFNVSTVAVANGKASFIYTAPNPLDGNSSLVFTFYHDAQPILSEKDLNITIIPNPNQVVLTNYILNSVYETTMNLDVSKQMTFYVSDDKGTKVPDSNMTSIKVTLLNSALGTLEDTNGSTGSSLTVNNKNNVQMNIKSNTISGVIPIQVDTKFKDGNNNDQNLSKVFNVVVLSGPPTAISLSYASTSQNTDNAKFIENWVLTVTDKYNNLINNSPAISMGMITGYAQSSDTTVNVAKYLYYDSAVNDGNLTNATPDTFTSSKEPFENVDLVNDKLVLFGGTGYRFDAYGKWDIAGKVDTNKTLSLVDDYNGTNVSGLGYAVGHNFRNETCDGASVVANVYAKDSNNILGSTGSMIIQVEYDYYLVGKSVVLWANLIGESNNTQGKIGIGRKATLRGSGLTAVPYNFAKGFQGLVRLNVSISNTVEWYKNANFGYAVEVSADDANWSILGSSMNNNITSCINNGVAYVDVNFTSPAASSGSVKLTNLLPSSEF